MVEYKTPAIDPKIHRRILHFLNAARRPEDLMQRPAREVPFVDEIVMHGGHADEPEEELKREPLLSKELAERVFEEREKLSPIYGFQHIRQVLEIRGFDERIFAHLSSHFSAAVNGEWETLYSGAGTPFRIAHAALLHDGWVLLLPESFSSMDTLLWNPEDATHATAIETLAGPATGLTGVLFCGAHSFLQDGKLLVVGGGTSASGTVEAWKYTPDTRTWEKTAGNGTPGDGDMEFARWYPTALTLGDDSGRVVVASGHHAEMEIYSESSDSFSRVWGPTGPGDTSADRPFSRLYPGLHLLPNGQLFFTRTGNATGTIAAAYFTFSSPTTGAWTQMAGAGEGDDRGQGMSVLLLRQQPADPDRILVVGGGSVATQATMGVIDSPPSAASTWLTGSFPDSEPRRSVNAVLLPDGTAFVSGGRPGGGTCWLYDPTAGVGAGAWSEMDELTDARQYHSVAVLLPSGKVMTTGGSSQKIEVFSPPYLFNADGTDATRPDITSFPDPEASPSQIVYHGSTFEIGTSNPSDVTNVVLVRPMAVTHQTDTEQRVIQLSFTKGATTLSVTAPDARVYPYGAGGGHTHATAGRGYYMLFILNSAGVPSEAKFIKLV